MNFISYPWKYANGQILGQPFQRERKDGVTPPADALIVATVKTDEDGEYRHYPRELAEQHWRLIERAPRLLDLLERAESFIAGFEGDETQEEPVDPLLEAIRAELEPVRTDRTGPTLFVVLEGGMVQGIISDDPGAVAKFLNGVVVVDYDTDGTPEEALTDVPQEDGTIAQAICSEPFIEHAKIDIEALLANIDKHHDAEIDE